LDFSFFTTTTFNIIYIQKVFRTLIAINSQDNLQESYNRLHFFKDKDAKHTVHHHATCAMDNTSSKNKNNESCADIPYWE
jgi:hypothetical protein